jgi:hypothetical protein
MGSLNKASDQEGWGFATMSKGPPFQVRVFTFLDIKCILGIVITCICVLDKKKLSVQVKYKPSVGIGNMRLFLLRQSTW